MKTFSLSLVTLASLDDKELCSLFAKGSTTDVDTANHAKSVLYNRWVDKIAGYVRKNFNITELDAEGVAASAVTNCIYTIADGGFDKSFKSYVYTAAKNGASEFKRKRDTYVTGKQEHFDALEGMTENPFAQNENPYITAIMAAMGTLRDEERDVLILETCEQMTLKEIAENLGRPYDVIRQCKVRAIKKVQKHPAVQKMVAQK